MTKYGSQPRTLTRWVYREMAKEIAKALEAPRNPPSDVYRQGIACGVRAIAEALKAENHRFRYDHFYAACGLNEWGYVPNDPQSPAQPRPGYAGAVSLEES